MSVSRVHPVRTNRCRASPVTPTARRGAVCSWELDSALCSWELDTEFGPVGPILVLRVAGEIDVLTVPVLAHALDTAVDQRPASLVVDLAGVGFCCVHGFSVLAAAAASAHTDGTGYALSGLSPHLDRVATLVWPEQRGVRYHSAAAAVTAIRNDDTSRPAG